MRVVSLFIAFAMAPLSANIATAKLTPTMAKIIAYSTAVDPDSSVKNATPCLAMHFMPLMCGF